MSVKSPLNHQQIGIIIVDHGSKREQANQMLAQFVELFVAHSSYRIIEPAHMELAEPSIATAFDRCVKRGAKVVIITPYFLSPGKHWDQDIPRLAATAAANHEGVSHQVTDPIGLHPLMIEVIGSRIDECLAQLKQSG